MSWEILVNCLVPQEQDQERLLQFALFSTSGLRNVTCFYDYSFR